MPALSLWDAAEQAGTSKSAIWRAVKEGRLSAKKDDSGNIAVDPTELFRLFSPQQPPEAADEPVATLHPTTSPAATPAPAPRAEADSMAVRIAALEAEIQGVKDLKAEIRAQRDELRAERDGWRAMAERLMAIRTEKPHWWRGVAG